LLRQLFIAKAPQTIICYGDKYRDQFKQLFRAVQNWTNHDIFIVGNWLDKSKIVLAPQLASKKMNGKAKVLAELARRN